MGRGTFGKVKLGTHTSTNEKVWLLSYITFKGGYQDTRQVKDQRLVRLGAYQQGNKDT